MRINFLTIDISKASGGAIYDKNFYEILKRLYPNVSLFNDAFFVKKYKNGTNLLSFNRYYKSSIDELLDCEYLVINSRLYTRMTLFSIRKKMKNHPRTKLLVIHHHSNYMNNQGFLRIIHRFFERRVLESATDVIIPNEYVANQVGKDFNIKNIVFLPSSFEKRKYPKSTLDSNMLLFVGNVESRKGIIYGIKAFKEINNRYPDLVYHIAGKYDENDSYYKELIKYVTENDLNDKVIFEGRVSDERLEWLYANAKLFLFPSMLEGYGWVMIEAMGRGVPVVAFDNSAMPYTVKDGENGLLIKNKDVTEMAKRICETLSDSSYLHRLQEGALKTFEKVPSQEELNRLTEEYIKSWR